MHIFIHTVIYVHTYVHTFIHTYLYIYIYIHTESVALQARVLKPSVFPYYRLGCCKNVASICFHAYKKSS